MKVALKKPPRSQFGKPSNYLRPEIKEVDIIIAGGGTAACVLAGRLAEADPDLQILLIEQGNNSLKNKNVCYPGLALGHLDPGKHKTKRTALFWEAESSSDVGDRALVVPSGGTLGGGSAINFMMYTRAQKCDFDAWNTPGWTSDDLLPLMKRLEKYDGPSMLDSNSHFHGFSGPVNISDAGHRFSRSENDYIEAAAAVGYPETPDLQDLTSCNRVSRWLRYVDKTGRRQDTAHAYLQKLLAGKPVENLHILVQHSVIRVVFDDESDPKRATGVELIQNDNFHPCTKPYDSGPLRPERRIIKSRKLVVVSCGALGTPLVLERSGVGDPEILARAQVPVVAEVPGVGNDYQDHNGIFPLYKTSLGPSETLNNMLRRHISLAEAVKPGDRRAFWNAIDVAAKVRPTDREVKQMTSEFQRAWELDFQNQHSKPLALFAFISACPSVEEYSEDELVTVVSYNAYPYSRGSIHITDDKKGYVFQTGYLSDRFDLEAHVWAYKKQREIMRRTKMFQGEFQPSHPQFPEDSNAFIPADFVPFEGAIQDIVYTPADDLVIEEYIRQNITTTWHSLGTAKMAPLAEHGVVDSHLNVHGVKCLKVIDLSIAPKNVGANTNHTAILIGEKGFNIIASALGLSIPDPEAADAASHDKVKNEFVHKCTVEMKLPKELVLCESCIYCNKHYDEYTKSRAVDASSEEVPGPWACVPCGEHHVDQDWDYSDDSKKPIDSGQEDEDESYTQGQRELSDIESEDEGIPATSPAICSANFFNGFNCDHCKEERRETTVEVNEISEESESDEESHENTTGDTGMTERPCECDDGYAVCEYHEEVGKLESLRYNLGEIQARIGTANKILGSGGLEPIERLREQEKLNEEILHTERIEMQIRAKVDRLTEMTTREE
ncbi:hypothetical protein LZ554_001146 [Drepanopeziza brunnea f. sp. 'monogermtubi']|nr:hypothetical protein LZ554_001146 [Drepanopeziza brunnea f. sp. 'monogermtubi']